MDEPILLIDGSVDTKTKIGYGAYLLVTDRLSSLPELRSQVKVRRFESTSSTRLELQTLLWAMHDLQGSAGKVTVCTDSQNIIGLPERRARLEQNDFCSTNNRRLNNASLYQEFFRWMDRINCRFIKVRGHQSSEHKDAMARLFSLVDRAARQALRADKAISI